MRKFAIAAIAILVSTTAYVACAAQNDAKPIPAQSRPATSPAPDPTVKTTGGKGMESKSYIIQEAPLKDDYVLGDRNAPVVMVEYASLSCPHCAHFSNKVLPELEKNYIQTGKVAYILRQFPLNEPAMRGAMLVDCVGESSEEKYYTFSSVLFDAQPRWAFDSNYMAGLETIATVGGLSKAQFNACVNDKDREMKILQQKKLANDELKVPHTPLIFVNGELYQGEKNYSLVAKFIDRKLAEASQ